ncbi:MAG: phenylalanine--tRNA ligase subunit beta [Dehalococcoidia bacterium]
MRVSLRWLAEYVDIDLPPRELAHKLTMAGSAVDAVERSGGDWEGISVGLVTAVAPHPNADRLRLATVELGGGEKMTVVCGAPNVAEGQKIAFGRVGAHIVDPGTREVAVLKPARIRGVESAGMVLSERELGISDEHVGILVLDEAAPIGTPLQEYMGDTVFDIAVTPNRADCLSMIGIAREVAALTGKTVRYPDLTYPEEGPAIEGRVAVEIADVDLCSRYVATLIDDVKIGPSPSWMQERLIAAGQRPISNIVDITNYVMLELGQPLHAFDFSLLGKSRIIVRRGRQGERLTTLDGLDHELTPEMLVIADANEAVALAGVMGGANSEVRDDTRTILLESANFNPASIRRTSVRLKARSEASSRFEKALSPELSIVAARRATKLMVELAGGKAAAGVVDAYPRKAEAVSIQMPRERLRTVLGLDLPTPQVCAVLEGLEFGCRSEASGEYVVEVPYWRTDVRIADDVAEEVARIVGYDALPMTNLRGEMPEPIAQPLRDLRERARDLLAAAGMQEVINYSLTTIEALGQVIAPDVLAKQTPLRAANPISSDHEYLRTSLRASVLQALAANLRYAEGEVALFEAARAYLPRGTELPLEEEHVTGVVGGYHLDRWGHPEPGPVDFYDAKGYVEALLRGLGVEAAFVEAEVFGMLPGRSAEVQVEGETIGVVGQAHPRATAAFDVDGDAYVFEIVLDRLLPLVGGPHRYEPVSRFPPVVQDIALVVDEAVTAGRIEEIIGKAPLVREVRLFDFYTGEQVGAGKKSLAFSVTYQSSEDTLTDEEVARAQRGIVERLKLEVGATLRA